MRAEQDDKRPQGEGAHRVKEAGELTREREERSSRIYLWRGGLLLALSLVVYIGFQTIRSTPLFNLEEVVLRGTQRLDEDGILSVLELERGQSLLGLELSTLEEKLEEQPWVLSATLERSLPAQLNISIQERRLAGVALLDGFWGLDEGGRPFVRLSAQEVLGHPLITGLDQESFSTEPEVGRRLFYRALELARLYADKPFPIDQRLSNLHITPVGRLELLLEQTRVSLGRDRLGERLERASVLLERLEREGRRPEYLILSDDLSRAIVKESSVHRDEQPRRGEESAR